VAKWAEIGSIALPKSIMGIKNWQNPESPKPNESSLPQTSPHWSLIDVIWYRCGLV